MAILPDIFLETRVSLVPDEYGTLAMCAGYEGAKWRADAFADHLMQWLPYAALNQEAQNNFALHNWMEFVRQAAAHIYSTKKSDRRGEIGELILHIICVTQFSTTPVLCKLILKTSSNDTVKGFDGVHVRLLGDGDFELWLGESKFYRDPASAIKEAVKSVAEHVAPDFLNTEKAMLIGHVAPGVPHRDELIKLFKSSTSSDDLLKRAVFPVLIAYDSHVAGSFDAVSDELVTALTDEVRELREKFGAELGGLTLRFQFILLPMANKGNLVAAFDKRLAAFV